jgi:hypothetical protein
MPCHEQWWWLCGRRKTLLLAESLPACGLAYGLAALFVTSCLVDPPLFPSLWKSFRTNVQVVLMIDTTVYR